jgi:putative tricarboxylic transport membrane protein
VAPLSPLPTVEMLGALASGFAQALEPTTFGLMLAGIAVGFVVGILPGLGGPTALAMMLPFSFTMQPVEAFAFLLGMAAVTATTGDITSVLFGVPGEPTTASTIVDGHPMAKRGEAGRALGAVLTSSLVGAILGALALALAVPVVRPLVLMFGSPEFFVLAVLGLTFVAALSGDALVKGLCAGGFGLLLATIGLDPQSGTQRFTFGQLFLWDGIGLVPVTIGLFAIPEVIDLAVRGAAIARVRVDRLSGVLEGVKDTFRHRWLVVRCSAIGAYLGVIPGMGGSVSQWVAYAHAVQSSPGKERFGKGAIEGVLGPGAANNSTLGGNLIPTIAFGVPGGVMTAILLGAFVIHGLVPGPDMLVPEARGGHLALTFSLVATIVVANLVTVAICFLFLRQLVRVTEIRASLLVPLLTLLIYLGAFTEKHAPADMLLVLLFGGLGWVMERLAWPRPPLILGLVLGPLAENRLFLATGNYGAAWLLRPWVLVLIALTLAGLAYPLVRGRARGAAHARPAGAAAGGRVDRGVWLTVGLVLVTAWALWASRGFGFRARLFPWAIGLPVLGFGLLQLGLELTGRSAGAPARPADDEDPAGAPASRRTAGVLAELVACLASLWLLGFVVGGPLGVLLSLVAGSRERWPVALLIAAGTGVVLYGVFDRILHVPFPPGQLWVWLGIQAPA